MPFSSLTAISPIDGRYHSKTSDLSHYFSEYGLIYYRVLVEIRWLQALAAHPEIIEVPSLSTEAKQYLEGILESFDIDAAEQVKTIEKQTNHDVKAVEYYIKQVLGTHPELAKIAEFTHFACTSEDINNVAYALMIRDAKHEVIEPMLQEIANTLSDKVAETANIAMLSRTHGQSASPTTLGKELRVFLERFDKQRHQVLEVPILAKFNGAVGNFNAHLSAYPTLDWLLMSQQFIQNLGLQWNAFTTQIEPHDFIAELFHATCRMNTVLIDFSRDIWAYISNAYFNQRLIEGEVGSSTMPHKVNPIDFENAEGNLGLANALLQYMAETLMTSRWQRDLTDSTLLRNVGSAFAHCIIAYQSLLKGCHKLAVNESVIAADLGNNWEVLAEAIQTVMRRYGVEKPYEQLKALTRGQSINQQSLATFIAQLAIPESEKQRLLLMTPANYIGLADTIAKME